MRLGPHLIEGAPDQTGADTFAAELGRHLGMLEGDDIAGALVIGRGEVAFDLELEAMVCGVVIDCHFFPVIQFKPAHN